MSDEPDTVALARPARRALTEQLPADVAIGATDLINGALATDPHRIGKPLDAPLAGLHSARLMRHWRIPLRDRRPHENRHGALDPPPARRVLHLIG